VHALTRPILTEQQSNGVISALGNPVRVLTEFRGQKQLCYSVTLPRSSEGPSHADEDHGPDGRHRRRGGAMRICARLAARAYRVRQACGRPADRDRAGRRPLRRGRGGPDPAIDREAAALRTIRGIMAIMVLLAVLLALATGNKAAATAMVAALLLAAFRTPPSAGHP